MIDHDSWVHEEFDFFILHICKSRNYYQDTFLAHFLVKILLKKILHEWVILTRVNDTINVPLSFFNLMQHNLPKKRNKIKKINDLECLKWVYLRDYDIVIISLFFFTLSFNKNEEKKYIVTVCLTRKKKRHEIWIHF